MRNFLLTLCMGAAALSAQADVSTFMAQGAPRVLYTGSGQIIELPAGFACVKSSEHRPKSPLAKAMVADNVMIEEVETRDAAGTALTTGACNYVLCGTYRWYNGRSIKITPADGLTLTKVEIRAQTDPKGAGAYNKPYSVVEPGDAKLNVIDNFVGTQAETQVWTGTKSTPIQVWQGSTTNRVFYIEVTTEGTSSQVALPVSSVKTPVLSADQKVELTCSTPGAKIYYTVNYENKTEMPTTASTLYTGPFTLDKDAVVRAIAVKEGMADSFPVYLEYYVVPEYTWISQFNFNDYTSLKDKDGNVVPVYATYPIVDVNVSTGTTQNCPVTADRPLVDKDVTFGPASVSAGNLNVCLSNSFGGVVELRPLAKSVMEFSVPEGKYISAVFMESSVCEKVVLNAAAMGDAQFPISPVNGARKLYRAEGKNINKVLIDGAGSHYVDNFYVCYGSIDGSGVDGVEADAVNEDMPVEYYNLQGVRVADPRNGIFIKRQGNKATKVLMK